MQYMILPLSVSQGLQLIRDAAAAGAGAGGRPNAAQLGRTVEIARSVPPETPFRRRAVAASGLLRAEAVERFCCPIAVGRWWHHLNYIAVTVLAGSTYSVKVAGFVD